MSVVRSTSSDQHEILANIVSLHCPEGIEMDCTYGNGSFYKKGVAAPKIKTDINALFDDVICADSTALPAKDDSISSLIFDPPFLTYIRAGREGNGSMIMAKRFSGYWRYDELEAHYIGTIKEAARVLKKKGVFIVKCQDIIHNHKMHCTHANVIGWAEAEGFRLKDLFVLVAKSRMPMPNRASTQKHARVFHSYFLVFVRL